MMHVPEHIFVPGDSRSRGYVMQTTGSEAVAVQSAMVVEQMRVPDRIVVAGGNAHVELKGQPHEILQDHMPNGGPDILAHPPSQLTLHNSHYPDIVDDSPRLDDTMSAGSIAIDENPLQELKIMRRQLGRLSTRVYQLEDENERRKNREIGLFLSVLIAVGALIGSAVFKKKLI